MEVVLSLGTRTLLSLLPGIAVAAAFSPAFAGEVVTSLTRYSTVFIIEIADLGAPIPNPDSAEHRVPARVRVTTVLKSHHGQVLPRSEFKVAFPQWIGAYTVQPYVWTGMELHAGQSYLIVSSAKAEPREMVESPEGAHLIMPDEDVVEDVRLLVEAASRPLVEQAFVLARAVSRSGTPHSQFLSEHVAALLHAARAGETAALNQALESAPATVFCQEARVALLWHLAQGMRMDAPEDEIRVFASLTARYFLSPPDKPERGKEWMAPYSPIELFVIGTSVRWFFGTEGRTRIFRESVAPEVQVAIRKRIYVLAADPRSAQRLADLNRMLRLLGPGL